MDQIIGAIIFLLIIIAQIIKSIREGAQQQKPDEKKQQDSNPFVVSRPKQGKQPVKQAKPKTNKPRLTDQPLQNRQSVFNNTKNEPSRQKALVKRLAPQGEGERFETDPGTLDTGRIVSPTFDPSVKPELESITGIYEQGVTFSDSSAPALSLNIADALAKPEGIIQAVIMAEILNRPAWLERAGHVKK